jgi:hypothetical protein
MKTVLLFATALAIVVSAGGAAAQYRDRGGQGDGYRHRGDRGRAAATFFVDDNFKGRSVFLDHPVRSLREFGMNDKISSIDVQSGRWLICVDDDFGGRCQTIDRSVRQLTRFGLDDKISSVRPLRDSDR